MRARRIFDFGEKCALVAAPDFGEKCALVAAPNLDQLAAWPAERIFGLAAQNIPSTGPARGPHALDAARAAACK